MGRGGQPAGPCQSPGATQSRSECPSAPWGSRVLAASQNPRPRLGGKKQPCSFSPSATSTQAGGHRTARRGRAEISTVSKCGRDASCCARHPRGSPPPRPARPDCSPPEPLTSLPRGVSATHVPVSPRSLSNRPCASRRDAGRTPMPGWGQWDRLSLAQRLTPDVCTSPTPSQ